MVEIDLGEKMKENLFKSVEKTSKIFKNRDIITPHYTPEKLPFREKQIKEIITTLSVALKGSKPNNLFLYGKTGTGKTATTKLVLSDLKEFAKKEKKPVMAIYMNCRNYNSKYKVLAKIVQKFYPDKDFIGYSGSFIYEKMTDFCEKNKIQTIVGLDEIDKVKDVDELVYALTRANDELKKGGISIIGISNQLTFKDRLDPRTKSSLCGKELVFPPYNAKELTEILRERVEKAFQKDAVMESAINLAAAFAARESGDARTAVMLLLRAGELAEKKGMEKVTDQEVKDAKKSVEQEITMEMINTLPSQQKLVLYAISILTAQKKGVKKLGKSEEKGVLFSGEVFDEYKKIALSIKENPVSARWFRQYLDELEMYGLIFSTPSGKGVRGNTRLIKLGLEAATIKRILENDLGLDISLTVH